MRSADKKCPDEVHAERKGSNLFITYKGEGYAMDINWDIKGREVDIDKK